MTITTARSHTARLPMLETLRGAASVAVVFHHIAQQMRGNTLAESVDGRVLLWLGGWGVTLFFVLSGFCIHGSVLHKAGDSGLSPDWRTYFARRARRILPGYFAALALSAALGCFGYSALIGEWRWPDILAHLTFTSSFSHDTAMRVNSVLWTVVVEAQFYLAYPLFIWGRNRLGLTRLTGLLLLLSLAIKLGGRLWLEEEARWTWHHSFLNLWWIWSLGALLAEVHAGTSSRQQWSLRLNHPWLAIAIGVGSLAVGCLYGRGPLLAWQMFESYALPLLATAVVAMAVFSPLATWRSKLGEGLGRISYSMYLFHPAALWLVIHEMPQAPLSVMTGVMLALSWFFAWLGYVGVERPFMRRPE